MKNFISFALFIAVCGSIFDLTTCAQTPEFTYMSSLPGHLSNANTEKIKAPISDADRKIQYFGENKILIRQEKFNTFFGDGAGRSNTTGKRNSFFGINVGYNNTTGEGNSFFGNLAGYYNTTGNGNSFFGDAAGHLNSTGYGNSFFGNQAGYLNKTGEGNSFFGVRAGQSNTTGETNSFFGVGAGRPNTTGGGNSFFGSFAGEANTTGSQNTIIGELANVGYADLTFASAIGSKAIVTASNTIQLGRNTLDTVRIGKLGTAGTTSLCQNTSMEIAACSSSIRHKSNIKDFRSGLDLIRKLRPVVFNWKDSGTVGVGLVAEDVEKVEPLLTSTNSTGEIEGVDYDRIGVVLVNAVQEQQEQIERQQKTIDRQQKMIDALKVLVCSGNKTTSFCKQ